MTNATRLLTHATTLAFLSAAIGWAGASSATAQDVPEHFTDCLESGSNSTVVITDTTSVTLGSENSLEPGDIIALFTNGENGEECAGAGVWAGENLSIAISGADDQTPSGYEQDEELKYRFWNASTGLELGGDVTYEICTNDSGPCRDEGTYVHDVVYTLASIEATDVLPVELTSFRAVLDHGSVLLSWQTASETNNAGFQVEHRAPGAAYRAAGFVEGEGTTTVPQRYQFRIDRLAPGTHRFRLKQTDFDGAYAYSREVELTTNADGPFQLSPVAPNPFRQRAQFTLSVSHSQHVSIGLYNVLGQRVATVFDGAIQASTAHPPLVIEAGSLPSGIYFVRVQGEHFATTRRVTLVR